MNWVVFALFSTMISTGISFSDKFIVERHVHHPRAMVMYTGIVALFWGIILWLVAGRPVLSTGTTLLIMTRGAMTVVGATMYFTAVSLERASNVILLRQTTPIATLVLSFLFLHETISLIQLAGFMLILTATIGVAAARSNVSGFKLSPAFYLISLGNLNVAVAIVLTKHIVENHRLLDILGYESFGLALGTLVLAVVAPPFRQLFIQSLRSIKRSSFGYIFFSESMFTVGKFSMFTALALGGPASLVSVLNGTQVFFGIFYGWGLMMIAPAVFQEDVTRRALVNKAAWAALLFAGMLLIR